MGIHNLFLIIEPLIFWGRKILPTLTSEPNPSSNCLSLNVYTISGSCAVYIDNIGGSVLIGLSVYWTYLKCNHLSSFWLIKSLQCQRSILEVFPTSWSTWCKLITTKFLRVLTIVDETSWHSPVSEDVFPVNLAVRDSTSFFSLILHWFGEPPP